MKHPDPVRRAGDDAPLPTPFASLGALVHALTAGDGAAGPAAVHGLTPPTVALLASHLASAEPGRPLLAVTASDSAARSLAEDLGFFLAHSGERGGERERDRDDPAAPPPVMHLPAIDVSPYSELSPDRRALATRMAALVRFARGGALMAPVVTLSAETLMRKVMAKREILARTSVIAASDEVDRDEVAAQLVHAGYSRTTVVEDPGSFAVRGGVIDIFSPLYRYPVRMELDGDCIDLMRLFDPDTQRTLRDLDAVYIHPVRDTIATSDSASVRRRLLAAADDANHPSKETRRVLERIETGEVFIGIETLTPAFHEHLVPLWSYFAQIDGGSDREDRHGGSLAAQWLIVDPDAVYQAVADRLEDAAARYTARVDDGLLAFAPEAHYVSAKEIHRQLAAQGRRIEVRTIEMLPSASLSSGPASAEDAVTRWHVAVDDNRMLRAELERVRRQNADELMKPLVTALATWRRDGWRAAVAAGSLTRARHLASLLREYDCPVEVHTDADIAAAVDTETRADAGDRVPPGSAPMPIAGGPLAIYSGDLSAGFALRSDKTAWLTADEIFGPRRRTTAKQRKASKRGKQALLGGVTDFSDLQAGDYIVHDVHGVGVYQGLSKLPLAGSGPASEVAIDFLHLSYRDGTLYLPVYRLGEVQRYVGAEGKSPNVDKLGGTTWQKTRRKVSVQVKALAEDLLKLYAQRAALPGHRYPPADSMFREFEATFPFDETPDQMRAIDDVIADMEAGRAMDRLVCGDVGYGKTEVALRACLKAVLGGKQAAILAPTTVLVEQHFRTMEARYAGFPVNLARLSRFQPRKAQVETIKGLSAGTIDIVVGTHRILSKDVRFKDLGLIIIDEEQRFGVAHKERLKRARTQVDVLTLTATPIPRTLHLAMSGLRDLSVIATPPADRRAVRTFVSRPEDGVLREAIARELDRGGQVYFVSPRIGGRIGGRTGSRGGRNAASADSNARAGVRKKRRTNSASKKTAKPMAPAVASRASRGLDEWAEHLQSLAPTARIAVAHGQLSSEELERVMVGFVDGELDILVSTMIVESGLDIPRANTMFIDRADNFGLAQLYQLRGRIGRSSARAFCYLLVPRPENLLPEARRRLEVLQRFSDLGAGFQIASHDLELRGGGELLGAKQSGAIAAVGFETYISLLEDAIAELKGQEDPALVRPRDPELNVQVPGYIPDDFVPDTGQRLDLYKRLSDAEDEDEVRAVLDEIRDRYGTLPVETSMLGELMVLKVYARGLRAQSLELASKRMNLALSADTPLAVGDLVELVQTNTSSAGARRGTRYRLTPDMRIQCSFAAEDAVDLMACARQSLLELLACVS